MVTLSTIGHKGLSPRGRGNRNVTHLKKLGLRSIPAWAGEPLHEVLLKEISRVYPRVGGGT